MKLKIEPKEKKSSAGLGWRWLYVVFALLAGMPQAFAQTTFSFTLKGQSLFKEEKKHLDEFEFIAGEMQYLEDEERDEEGYAPRATLMARGPYMRQVLDYQVTDSAVEIAQKMQEALSRQGYSIVFSCEKNACGDVAAWQLYLSNDVSGQEERQYYYFARKDSLDARVELVSVYINEFTRRPRAIIDRVSSTAFDLGSIQVAGKTYAINNEHKRHVYFDTDSSVLKPNADTVLMELIDGLDDDEALLIVGHADSTGASKYNHTLSEARANSVKRFFLDRSIDPQRVFVRGDGDTAPVASNQDEAGRAKNRRTAVYRVAYIAPR